MFVQLSRKFMGELVTPKVQYFKDCDISWSVL